MPVVSTISKHLSYLTPKRDKPQAQINLIVGELIATVLQALCAHSRGIIHESLTEAKYPLMHSCTVNGCTCLKSLYSLYLLHIIHSSLKYEVILLCMVRESLLCCILMPKHMLSHHEAFVHLIKQAHDLHMNLLFISVSMHHLLDFALSPLAVCSHFPTPLPCAFICPAGWLIYPSRKTPSIMHQPIPSP